MSDLAWEIVAETMGNYDYVFVGGNAPLARNAMANAPTGHQAPKERQAGAAHARPLPTARPRPVHAA